MNVRITMDIGGQGEIYRDYEIKDGIFPDRLIQDMFNTLVSPSLEETISAFNELPDGVSESDLTKGRLPDGVEPEQPY